MICTAAYVIKKNEKNLAAQRLNFLQEKEASLQEFF